MPRLNRAQALQYIALPALALVALTALVFIILERQPETVIILVRHAERSNTPPPPGECPPPGLGLTNSIDTSITEAGRERAVQLAHVGGAAGVSAIYVSEVCRSQWTVKPLADRLGLQPTQINAADVDGLVNHILSNHRGETVLVSSHSNRAPQIVTAFGAEPVPAIADNDYDNLFVISVRRFGKPRVVRLKYGRET